LQVAEVVSELQELSCLPFTITNRANLMPDHWFGQLMIDQKIPWHGASTWLCADSHTLYSLPDTLPYCICLWLNC
jgi:hypothetical protein